MSRLRTLSILGAGFVAGYAAVTLGAALALNGREGYPERRANDELPPLEGLDDSDLVTVGALKESIKKHQRSEQRKRDRLLREQVRARRQRGFP